MRIFLSYRSTDAAIAAQFREALEGAGFDVVAMDQFQIGERFQREMQRALATTDAMFALWTPDYFESPMCMAELEAAHLIHEEEHEGYLTPVKIAPCTAPYLYKPLIYLDLTEGFDAEAVLVASRQRKPRPGRQRDPSETARAEAAEAPASFAAEIPLIDNLPIEETPLFGRDAACDEVAHALIGGDIALGQALRGLGGVGKTTLARAVARRADVAAAFPLRWWIDAEREDGVEADFAALAARLDPQAAHMKPGDAASMARARLEQSKTPALLIFDNIEDPGLLNRWAPRGARLLVTTRGARLPATIAKLDLDLWSEEQTARFLRERTGDDDGASAQALAEALGGLPLAAEQAVAYCEAADLTLAQYLRRFEADAEAILANASGLAPETAPVAVTFRLAIDRAAEQAPGARDMLAIMAELAPEPLPEAVFLHDGAPAALRTEAAVDAAVIALRRHALIGRVEAPYWLDPARVTPCVAAHRLVLAAARSEGGAAAAARALSGAFPGDEQTNVAAWPLYALLAAHADAGWARPGLWPDAEDADAASRALDRAAAYLQFGRGAFQPARAFFKAALDIAEEIHGPDHPKVATRLSNLANVLRDLGGAENLAEARRALDRAIGIYERAHGPDHPEVATALSNLANVLGDLGGAENLAEARRALERAITIGERANGPDHPKVATALSNLANVLRNLGGAENLAEARRALERAITIDERAHGPDHPEVATALSNLANVLGDLGGAENLAEARRALERAITIDERANGPDHPNVATALSNLANVLRNLGGAENLAEARRALERAITIGERAHGPDHPKVATRLSNLANVLGDLGGAENLAEARRALERAITIDERAIGPDHPKVGIRRINLAHVLMAQGEGGAAREEARRGHAIFLAALGPDHGHSKIAEALLRRLGG